MATALADGVWRLHCWGVNAYLLDDGDLTLVDAGSVWDAGRIRSELADAGCHPGDLDRILLTHYDVDHAGAIATLSPALEAPVYAADPDRAYLAGLRRPPLASRKETLQRLTGWLVPRPSVPVRPLSSGDEFGSIRAVRAPGHTPGHTVFVSETLSTVCFGDALRAVRGSLRELWPMLTQSPDRARRTIVELADQLPPFDVACVGHGAPLPQGGDEQLGSLAARL